MDNGSLSPGTPENKKKSGAERRCKVATVFLYIFGSLAAALSLARLAGSVSMIPTDLGSFGGQLAILMDFLILDIASGFFLVAALILNLSVRKLGTVWNVAAALAVLYVPFYYIAFLEGYTNTAAAAAVIYAVSVILPNLTTVIASFDLSVNCWRAKK